MVWEERADAWNGFARQINFEARYLEFSTSWLTVPVYKPNRCIGKYGRNGGIYRSNYRIIIKSDRIGIIGSSVFGALIRLECRPKILNLMKQNIRNVWFDGTRRVRRRVRVNRVRFGVGTSSRLACFQRHRDASTILSRCATVHFKRKFFVRGKKVGSFKSRFPRRGVLLAGGNALLFFFFNRTIYVFF